MKIEMRRSFPFSLQLLLRFVLRVTKSAAQKLLIQFLSGMSMRLL